MLFLQTLPWSLGCSSPPFCQNRRDSFQHWIATNFMMRVQTALATEGINCQIKEMGKERRYTFYLWSDRLRWRTTRGRGRRHFAMKDGPRDGINQAFRAYAVCLIIPRAFSPETWSNMINRQSSLVTAVCVLRSCLLQIYCRFSDLCKI